MSDDKFSLKIYLIKAYVSILNKYNILKCRKGGNYTFISFSWPKVKLQSFSRFFKNLQHTLLSKGYKIKINIRSLFSMRTVDKWNDGKVQKN